MKNLTPSSFTLVEILAATTVLSILFAIMFGILQQTSRGWQAANRRVEASQVARLAMDQIAYDLENCVVLVRSNLTIPTNSFPVASGYGFFHSNEPSMNQSWLPASINISRPNDFIFVVTPYNPSLTLGSGDLCEVGYIPIFVASQTGFSTMRPGRYVLLRHMPLQYGAGNSAVTNAQPLNDFVARPNDWETTCDLAGQETVSTTNRLPFVDNCIKFNIQFLYTNANGRMLTTNSWGRPFSSGNVVTWRGNPPDGNGGFITGLPVAADIEMCVIDERAAERIWRMRGMTALDLPEKQGIPTNWMAVRQDLRSTLQESVLTLQRRVYFKNAVR